MNDYQTFVVEREIKTTVRMVLRTEVLAKDEEGAKHVAQLMTKVKDGEESWKTMHSEMYYLDEVYTVLGTK